MTPAAAVAWELFSLGITAAQIHMKEDQLVTRAKERAGEDPTAEQVRDALRAVMDEERQRAIDATRE
jgi:hypothetical protein